MLSTSCNRGCVFPLDYSSTPVSMVTYLQNTLDYPIIVQAYYIPFDNDTAWTTHDEKAYGDPVEIQPGEAKMIMDYVLPSHIEIKDAHAGLLLHDYIYQPPFPSLYLTTDEALVKIKPTDKLGFYSYNDIASEEWDSGFFWDAYFLKNDRYLSRNIDWNEYPIWFQYEYPLSSLLRHSACGNSDQILEERKTEYEHYFNGYAMVQFLTTNTAAECFVQR